MTGALSNALCACRFFHTDMQTLRKKQETFLTMALGGPCQYSGADMYLAHQALVAKGLNDVHFDALDENLVAALVDLSVDPSLIHEIHALVETLRDLVLCRVTPERM
jgi:hemoglobin